MKLSLPNRNHRSIRGSSLIAPWTLATLALALLSTPAILSANEPAAPAGNPPLPIADPGETSETKPDAAPSGPDGQQIVREAAQSLARLPSLSARIRQKVDLNGAQLTGTGTYLQLGSGENRLHRLSMKTQVEKHVSSMQQVCDGRYLWQRRDMPDGITLQRVDLKRLRENLPGGSEAAADGLAIGGLPRLLEGLVAKYQFSAPRAVRVGNLAALQLEGKWRSEGPTGDAIPRRVQLVLGQDDRLPYRIEFQRLEKKSDEENPWRTMMSLEFYDLETNASIDPLQFVYKPDNQTVTDATDLYLRKFGARPVEQARKPGQPR